MRRFSLEHWIIITEWEKAFVVLTLRNPKGKGCDTERKASTGESINLHLINLNMWVWIR